ncbi:MAG: hypothetical protein AAB365_01025 [Patescibacteria group bacterium]
MNQKNNSGLILIDILLALALGAFFIACITYSSVNAEELFETARERDHALDLYDAHKGEFEDMMPYEFRNTVISPGESLSGRLSRLATTTIEAYAHWYGNDRIQTDIRIHADTKFMNRAGPIMFNAVRRYPFVDTMDSAGTPVCSVDFASKERTGSYGFQHPVVVPDPGIRFSEPSASLLVSIVPIMLPIDPSLPLTDMEVRNNIAYVSADSSIVTDPDLLVVDIRDVHDPGVLSSIHTGPGISAITLVGHRVYGAAASTAAQLHIIRFDALDVPVLEKKYQIPLPYATATPPMASSIFYDADKIYLGTEKWDGEELSVIDVTDTASMKRMGGVEVGSKVMDIFGRNKSVYLATAGEQQLMRLDSIESGDVAVADNFNPSGWERQEGKSISVFEDVLRFGRTAGGFNVKRDHELFVWATSTIHTGSVGSLKDSGYASSDIPGGIYGLVADRSYLYAASRATDKEFRIFSHSASASTSAAFLLPAAPQMLTCDGDKLYILAATAPMIYQVSFK